MLVTEVTRFGPPDVLVAREIPAPEPGPGEVAVDVAAAEVLFLDTLLRAGWGQEYFPVRPPYVPGSGVSGVVVAVGAGVDDAVIGHEVVARTGHSGDCGGYAERVVVPAAEAVAVPAGVDLATAVGALHDGVLALDRFERLTLGPDSRVLVTAAAGGAASWFVALAARAGATVVGVAGGPAKVAAVAAAGAHRVVDHRADDWVVALSGEEPFDVVFEGAGGETARAAFALTVDGGTFFGHGVSSGDFGVDRPERGITMTGVEARIDDDAARAFIRRGLDLVATGAVRPAIGFRAPLRDAVAAHEAIARREVCGKTVLLVGGDPLRSA